MEMVVASFNVLFEYLTGRTEENHDLGEVASIRQEVYRH
jgi:hypothetical protein